MSRYVRLPTWDDIAHVAANMRHNDMEEVRALGFSPLEGLQKSVDNAKLCYTLITPDQEPCAILGVGNSPIDPSWGALWLLGTPAIEQFPKTFVRNSKIVLDDLFERSECTVLYNYCHNKNALHKRWLKWLNFTFLRTVQLPPYGEEFVEFVKLRNTHVH
jgi:hypothetical protein